MDHHQEHVQEERSTFTKTTKSVRVVQHSSESVESSSSLGEFGIDEGSPLSSRKELRQLTQIQKTFNNSGDLLLEPHRFFERFSGKEADFEDLSTQIVPYQKQDTFEMTLDVKEYAPENIQVKVLDDVVVITGKQEIRINENNFKSRSFSKKFNIPPGVTPEKIKCSLTKDGTLKISAPVERETRVNTSTVSNSSSKSDVVTDSSTGITPKKVNASGTKLDLGTFVDDKTFTVRVQIEKFVAEEIKIKVTKFLIKVEGKHESEFASRSFYKEYTTNGIKVEQTECTLSTDGILTIKAPIDSSPNTVESTRQETQETQVTQRTVQQQQQQVTQQQQKVTQQEVTQQVTQQQQQVTQQTEELTQQRQDVTRQDHAPPSSQQPIDHHPGTPRQPATPSQGPVPSSTAPSNATPPRSATPVKLNTAPQTTPTFDADSDIVPVQTLPSDEPRVTSPTSPNDGPNEIATVNDGKTLKVRVNVTEYTREELRVTIVKRMIVIEGSHEDSLSCRSFLKKVPIPDGVEPKSIKSGLAPNGVLVVTAPVTPGGPVTNKPEESTPITPSGPTTNKPEPRTDVTETSLKTQTVTVKKTEESQEIVDDDFVIVPTTEPGKPEPRPASPEAPKEISKVLNEDKFELVLDVSKYKREEIVVKVSKTTIRIEGKQTKEFSTRSFVKDEPIPDGVEPNTVKSTFTPDGHLTISAPVQKKPTAASPSAPVPQPQAPKEITHKIEQDFSEVNVQEISKQQKNTVTKSSSTEEVNKVTQANDGKTFKVVIDVKEYRREEISIRITKTVIRVEGKKETKFASKSFFKEIPLPEGVPAKSITSEIDHNGMLTITGVVTQTHERNSTQDTSVTQQQRIVTEQERVKQVTQQQNIQEQQNLRQTQNTQLTQQQNIQEQQNLRQTQNTQLTQQQNVQEQQNLRQTQNTQLTQNQNQTTTTQRSTTSQQTTTLKTTLDLNAAKETIEGGAVREIDRNEKMFTMVYNVSGYGPEDISIRVTKYVVTVEGKQCTEFSSRSFTKKFSIPHGVDPRDFQPSLTAEGILTFSAPINHDLPITYA